jgi:glycosyltransferase involved in cell wall biosynthesis
LDTFRADRVLNRFFDYPRFLKKIATTFDLFHIVDHSYSHLVHHIPKGHSIVTCHDLDTFRSVLDPDREPRSAAFRTMTKRILSGLKSAGMVVCPSATTREELLSRSLLPAERLVVVQNGVHCAYSPKPDPTYDQRITKLLGPPTPEALDLLHVASTMPRKRIDVLLRVFAAIREKSPSARLVRVGGAFTAAQSALVKELAIGESIIVMPYLERRELAALYRRVALLLMPSDAEGFGLPIVEAMACGTPVVATALPVFREVGGAAVEYCERGDVAGWSTTVLALATERRKRPQDWRARCSRGLRLVERLGPKEYASQNLSIYRQLANSRRGTA